MTDLEAMGMVLLVIVSGYIYYLIGRILKMVGPMFSFNMRGKTVIHFTTHGCMGEQHEFDYIGVIVGKTYPRHCDGKMFYKVKVLKNKKGYELRDTKEEKFEEVPSWYLQSLGGDFYCAYD